MLAPLESESPTDVLENKEPLVQEDSANFGELPLEYRVQR